MSNTEKQSTDAAAGIRTMENHAPILPALDELKKPDTQTPNAQTPDAQTPDAKTPDTKTPDTQTPEPAAEDGIVTLENHAPAPPALDLNGK